MNKYIRLTDRRLFKDCTFAIMMAFFMVFCMATYNKALQHGFTYYTFVDTLKTMWPEALVAFILQKFIAAPVVRKLLPLIVDAQNARPLFVSVCMGGLTVFLMAPMMTLFVALLTKGIVMDLPLLWLRLLTVNFAFALCIQIFYVGPFVRLLHGLLFNRIFKSFAR